MKFILLVSSLFLLIACSENTETVVDNITKTSENAIAEKTEAEIVSEKVPELTVAEEAIEESIESVDAEINEKMVEKETTILEETATTIVEKGKEPVAAMKEKAEVVTEEIPQPTNVPLKPNHDEWDVLVRANVSSSGKVNYSGMKSNTKALEGYITYLESFATRSGWSKNEKLAYWINLYNAATVRLIVENYPVASITDLSGGKPWDQDVVKVGTSSYSLNDIENNIIRPRFKDGRIHFAVNCAAKSCPPIMNKAFTAGSLSRYLEKQTKSFINGSANTLAADKVVISKIFDWYKVDFEGGDVIAFLNKYSTTPINSDAEITYNEYDWSLNK